MLNISLSAQWDKVFAIYGSKDIERRYQWFLFEFGKRASKLFYKHLLQQISDIPGTAEYKKRLVLAEIRDKGREAWWAIVASAKPLGDAKFDPRTHIFIVEPKIPGLPEDPVREILMNLGPWTIDTLPFIPSERTGQVIMLEKNEAEVDRVKEVNFSRADRTDSLMVKYGIGFPPRHTVYQKLKVIRDWEVDALAMEFGMADRSKPHWRPSLRWIRRQGMNKMEKDKDMIRIWVDPKFAKFMLYKHYRAKITTVEIKRMEEFQKKVRQG